MTSYPVLFLSHGSPMHALTAGPVGAAWAAEAAHWPKPRAILMVSAHWNSNIPLLTGGVQLPTIHDFGGFPDALYQIQYPAAGAPELAMQVRNLLRAHGIGAGIDPQRGLDHGAWVPLLYLYPDADVPVVQLSIQPDLGARHHLALGQALTSLRQEGVLIIASGHMTHNLGDYFRWQGREGIAEYAQGFRDWVDAHLHASNWGALLDWQEQAPGALRAHPTPEHFLPLFVALGAAGANAPVSTIYQGFDGGALAMDAYRLG